MSYDLYDAPITECKLKQRDNTIETNYIFYQTSEAWTPAAVRIFPTDTEFLDFFSILYKQIKKKKRYSCTTY